MGYTFGGAVIDFDFRKLLAARSAEVPRDDDGSEEPWDEAVAEAGALALAALELRAREASMPISFDEATSRYFDHHAVGFVAGKTVILGRGAGLYQEDPKSIEACKRVSRERGTVLPFWFDDTSGSYMFSVFRDGERVRFRSRGEGMDGEEGAPVAGEPEAATGPHDHQLTLLNAIVGQAFFGLDDVVFMQFDTR